MKIELVRALGGVVLGRNLLGIAGLLLSLLLGADTITAEETWGSRLGYPAEQRILLLHADDLGMAWEANVAGERYLEAGKIQSGSVMVPAPWFGDFARWWREHPEMDLGIHLTLHSEWEGYRWKPVERSWETFTLTDEGGFLSQDLESSLYAWRRSVRRELEAQIEAVLDAGLQPTHLDSHMGALFLRPDLFELYLDLSRRYGIPAMTFRDVQATGRCLLRTEVAFLEEALELYEREVLRGALQDYPFPSLDLLCSMPDAGTYEEFKERFKATVRDLPPGITQFFLHPMEETEGTRRITRKWQKRVWEGRIFEDPEIVDFLTAEGVGTTSWREMMRRFSSASAATENN